jgi:hypothetical protein
MRLYVDAGIVGVLDLSGGQGERLDAALEAARAFEGPRAGLHERQRPAPVPARLARPTSSRRCPEAKAKGARGLKLHKALGLAGATRTGQRVKVDDPRLDPIFERPAG